MSPPPDSLPSADVPDVLASCVTEVTHDGISFAFPTRRDVPPVGIGCAALIAVLLLAAAAFATEGTLGGVVLSALALPVGAFAAWSADRRVPRWVLVDLGSTRLRVQWVGTFGRQRMDLPLAHVVGVETRSGGLVLWTDTGREVVPLPGQSGKRIRAIEKLVEERRERMNPRAGRQREVPEDLRGLRAREPEG